MGLRFGSEIRGFDSLRATFAGMGDLGKVDRVLNEAAHEVEAQAKLDAAVDTGRLRGSGRTLRLGQARYAVRFDVEYGSFVEMGTGQRGRSSPQPGGVPADYQHGGKPGMPAQPFLRPAAIAIEEFLSDKQTWRLL